MKCEPLLRDESHFLDRKRDYYFSPPPLLSGKLYHWCCLSSSHEYVEERHRHRYEVNPDHVKKLEDSGMAFVGHSTDNTRMEIMELKGELPAVFVLDLW